MVVDSAEITEKFRRGRQAHREGDLHAARRVYQEVLAVHPEHVPALHALGDVCISEAQPERAVALLGRALQLDPNGRGLYTSLGQALLLLGRRDEALDAHRKGLAVSPDSPRAHYEVGTLLLADGLADKSIAHFKQALVLAPDFAPAAAGLGHALLSARRFADAEKALQSAIGLDSGSADTHAYLGHALLAQQRFEQARGSFDTALSLDAAHRQAHLGLGLLLRSSGRDEVALRHFEQVLSGAPDDVTALRQSAEILFASGLLEPALERLVRALESEPYDPDLLTQAARVSEAGGDQEAALEYFRRALAQKSSHQSALSGFALLMAARGDARAAAARLAPTVNSGRAGPELLATYAQLLGDLERRREGIALLEAALQKTVPEDIARRLHFTLARLLDRDKSYDLAFFHCRRANAMVRAAFDPDAFRARIDRTIEVFDAAALAAMPQTDAPPAVFVVGMPRSGLDVCRSVLRMHPQLHMNGASSRLESGVLGVWDAAGVRWPELPSEWSAAQFNDVAQRVAGTRASDRAGRAFVDTSWRNFLYLGVISRLFPQLRVVQCVRDARDVALSCYFLSSTKGAELSFAYDLAHIAAYYNGYRRLMAHWRRVLDVPMLNVGYEELALNPEATCETVADFLGVDWQPAHFGLGASEPADGVPVSWRLVARSVRRYRHYRQHLESFAEALDALPAEHP